MTCSRTYRRPRNNLKSNKQPRTAPVPFEFKYGRSPLELRTLLGNGSRVAIILLASEIDSLRKDTHLHIVKIIAHHRDELKVELNYSGKTRRDGHLIAFVDLSDCQISFMGKSPLR